MTLQSRLTYEMKELQWDDRKAIQSLALIDAEVCVAMARYASAVEARKVAWEWKSKTREALMHCKKDWGRFVDIKAFEKDQENQYQESQSHGGDARPRKYQSLADWREDIKRAITASKEGDTTFAEAEEQVVFHAKHGLAMEEAIELYHVAKKEWEQAEAENERLLQPDLDS